MCYNQTLRRATPLSHGAVVSCFGVGRSRKVLTAPRAFPPHSSHASLDLGEALEPEQALYGTALPNFGASSATGASSDEANDSGCCSVLHPGSLSCMFTDVRSTNGQLVLSATATVHDTRHPDHVGKATGLPELEELAWLALKMEAENQISQLEAQCKLPRGGMGRHEHIIHILTRGDVVAAERRSNSFGHTAAVVTLVDPQTKQWCQAFFKPSMKGDGDGWHRVKIEAAAYRLNLLLGMDYVPPAVFRTAQRDADWCSKVCGHDVEDGGVFVYWCPDSKDLKSIEPGDWGVRQDVLLSDTRILVSAHDDALGSRPLMQLAGAYASAHTGMRMGGPCLTRQHDGAGALLSFGFECSHWDHVGPHWNWVHRVGWWCVAGGTA